MSIFIQEVLGLLHRNKKQTKVDYKRDYIEIGKVFQSSVGNPGYQPKGEPFIVKLGDLKCQLLENVVLQNGTATVKTLPMYAPVSGTCINQNTSIEDSIVSQSTVGGVTSININGGLIVEGATTLKTKIELGVAGDAVNGTSLFNRILDSAGAQAGAANRILRSLPDGRVVWSDDDPVVSLTYGSIWRGSAANVKEELAIGTAGQVLTADGTTASWANPAVSGTGSANNMTMWTSATTIGNSAPVPMIQSGTGSSATLTIGDGNDQNIVADGILYVNGPVKDAGGNLGTAGQILRADSSSQLVWTSTMIAGLNFNDDVKLTFGDVGVPGDLEIFHNANNSIIKDTGTGSLFIQGSNLILQASLTKNAIICGDSDSVDIYYNGALKLQTANTGIKITGGILDVNNQLGTAGQVLSSTGTTLDWIDATTGSGTTNKIPLWTPDGSTLGDSIATQSTALITIAGAINVSGTNANQSVFQNSGAVSNTIANFKGSAQFDDNAVLRFGNSSDLSIYHSTVSNNSIIGENGTGDLLIHGQNKIRLVKDALASETYADFNVDAGVNLYHNNIVKFQTVLAGATVRNGGLTVDGPNGNDGFVNLAGNGVVKGVTNLRLAAASTDVVSIITTGVTITGTLAATGAANMQGSLTTSGSGANGYLYVTGNTASANPTNVQGMAFAYNNSGGSRENELFFNPGSVTSVQNSASYFSIINEYLDSANGDARVTDSLLKLYGNGNVELVGPAATSTISNTYWRLPKVAAGNTGMAMVKSPGSIDLEWKDVNTYEANVDTVPASPTSAGTAGQIKFDANHIYVCYATNNWRRAALSTF